MPLAMRSGAVAITALLALAGCSSSDEASTDASDNPICSAMADYRTAYNDTVASFGPEIGTASQKKQEAAMQELLDVMVEETQLLAEQIPDDAPDDVEAAFEAVETGMEEKSSETPELKAANATITSYVEGECPGLFPASDAPVGPDSSQPQEDS